MTRSFSRASSSVAVGTFQSDSNECRREIICWACGANWNDVYRLAGYEALDGEGDIRPR